MDAAKLEDFEPAPDPDQFEFDTCIVSQNLKDLQQTTLTLDLVHAEKKRALAIKSLSEPFQEFMRQPVQSYPGSASSCTSSVVKK